MAEDRMLNDEILLGLIKANGGGGGGGTTNYNLLENKPQIAGTELQGNKSLADLGIASASDLAAKQDAMTAGDYVSINNGVIKVTKSITDKTFRETVGYTGEIQKVTVPYAGKYKLQVWGASGGSISASARGGYGGYSEGFVDLNANDELYVVVGGKGNKNSGATAGAAGYNGGGNANQSGRSDISRGSGGGATHIAKVSGVLSALSANVSDILIVAGGGGGAGYYSGSEYGMGGSGGGYRGANGSTGAGSSPNGNGGTENAGGSGYPAGSFGQGGNRTSGENYGGSGGGGGFYGGGASQNNGGAGGGSGYLNQNLEDGCMYGFGVPETSIEGYKTISVNTYDSLPVEKTAKDGDGYAIISLYTDESADLVTKGELNTELNAIKDGQNIDSFADVELALASKQNALIAGDYIDITNDEISVNPVVPNNVVSYEFKTKDASGANAAVTIIKKSNGEVVSSTDYHHQQVNNKYITIDDTFYFGYNSSLASGWAYKLIVASDDHSVNFVKNWGYDATVDYTETFTTDHSGEKLVIKSEMDTALAEKTDTDMVAADFNAGTSYTAGNYCVQDGKLYKFKNNHSGAWSAADVDEVKITGELSALKSGLTNLIRLYNSGETTTNENGVLETTIPKTYTVMCARFGDKFVNMFTSPLRQNWAAFVFDFDNSGNCVKSAGTTGYLVVHYIAQTAVSDS